MDEINHEDAYSLYRVDVTTWVTHFSRKSIKNQTQTYWVNVEQQHYNLSISTVTVHLSIYTYGYKNRYTGKYTISNNIV